MATNLLSPKVILTPVLLGALSLCAIGHSQIFEESIIIDSRLEFGLGVVGSIQSDGITSPTIVVEEDGRIAAPSGIEVVDESKLVLNGGSLANFLRVEDNATFVFRRGEIGCNSVAGGCAHNPLLNPLVFATNNATLEIFSDNLLDNGYFDLRDDSVAKIYGIGLSATLQVEPILGVSIVTIEGMLPQEVNSQPLTLRLRDNASFEIIEVPEPSTMGLSLGLIISSISLFTSRSSR